MCILPELVVAGLFKSLTGGHSRVWQKVGASLRPGRCRSSTLISLAEASVTAKGESKCTPHLET